MMATGLRLLCILLTIGIASVARGAEECPWLYSNFVQPRETRTMDPSDYKAIQDLLKNVFMHPQRTVSADAQMWITEFNLQPIVDRVRAEGMRTQKELRRQRITKRVAVASGASLVTAVLARKFVVAAYHNMTLEETLNERFGLQLAGNPLPELRFLSAMLECNPNPVPKIPAVIRSRLAPFTKVRDLAVFLLLGDNGITRPEGSYVRGEWSKDQAILTREIQLGAYEPMFIRLLDAYNRTGLVFCTRWGGPASYTFKEKQISTFLNTLEGIGFERKKDFMDLRGVVLVPNQFQDKRAMEQKGGHSGLYSAGAGKGMIQLFRYESEGTGTGVGTDSVDETLGHEMGHHLSRQNGYGRGARWLLIYAKGLRQPREERPRIFPSGYAKTSPEEFFAEAVGQYLREKACRLNCQSDLHPEVRSYLEETVGR